VAEASLLKSSGFRSDQPVERWRDGYLGDRDGELSCNHTHSDATSSLCFALSSSQRGGAHHAQGCSFVVGTRGCAR